MAALRAQLPPAIFLGGALYLEKKVAAKVGLSRVELRLVRRQILRKRKDWWIVGRELVITQPALAKLLEYLSATSNAKLPGDFNDCRYLNGAQEKKEAAEPAGVELIVKRVFPNPRLLLATDSEGKDVRVTVRANQNFVPKMRLLARPPMQPGGAYQMTGRCPRYKGRY